MINYQYKDNYTHVDSITLSQILKAIQTMLEMLEDKQDNSANLLQSVQVNNHQDLIKHASFIKENFERVVFIGMGGAILIPMTIAAFKRNAIQINYLDTTELDSIHALIQEINFDKTAFIIVSKSGQTIETLTLFQLFLEYVKQSIKSSIKTIEEHFYFIIGKAKTQMGSSIECSKSDNQLRLAATSLGSVVIDHEDISGRYSVFGNVGLFSALIAGLNVELFCEGGKAIINDIVVKMEHSIVARSTIFTLAMYVQNIRTSVLMPYISKLRSFSQWQAQIIAESLSRNKSGITPLIAQGPQDQHTQLQLFLDGPQDKFFTLIYNDIDVLQNGDSEIECNARAVLKSGFEVVLHSLIKNKAFVRTVHISNLDEMTLGMLMMHTMLEAIIIAKYLCIDPFDQPAIQQVKDLIQSRCSKKVLSK